MNAQKPLPSTAASATPAPKAPASRNAKPGAPFTPFARDRAAAAAPTGETSPLEAWMAEGPSARDMSLLGRWIAAAPSTGAVVQAPQPPLDATADAKTPRADAMPSGTDEPRARPHAHDDPLDPMLRQPALLGPPATTTPASAPEAAVAMRASTSLEELLPQLVRKIAWSGDGKRGVVRMELGAGALAGATLMLESEGGRVRVQLDAPPGVDGEAWKRRIGARLAERRIEVESIEVR
jgi:hypothetical protein